MAKPMLTRTPSTTLEDLVFLTFLINALRMMATYVEYQLKEHLITLIVFLDRIWIAYTYSDIKDLTIRNLNPQSLPQLIPNNVVTEEDILCSVLGLQRDIADRLRDLDPGVRSHQRDMYFLQGFLADQDESSTIAERLTNTEAVSSKLQEMGFTKGRSVVVAKWIAEQRWAEHQSLLAWAQHYIQNVFTYDIYLNDCVSRYPYEEIKQNKWFSVSVERYGDDDDDAVVITKVQVINTNYSRASELIKEIEKNQPHRIYYHGTDHLSAKSILEDGINLGMGKSGCDFSSGSGFYLADSSKYATEWAKKSTAAAVLMFCISEDCLNDYKIFDLSNESQKLKEVRNHFGNNEKLSDSTRQEYRKCDYIKGPLDSIPNGVTQICIKSEEMAVDIGNAANLCAVIFMNNLKLMHNGCHELCSSLV